MRGAVQEVLTITRKVVSVQEEVLNHLTLRMQGTDPNDDVTLTYLAEVGKAVALVGKRYISGAAEVLADDALESLRAAA